MEYSLIVQELNTEELIAKLRTNPRNHISGPHQGDYLILIGDIPQVEFGCCQFRANTGFQVLRHYQDSAYVPFLEQLIVYLTALGIENDMFIDKR